MCKTGRGPGWRLISWLVLLTVTAAAALTACRDAETELVLATTTSTENSGLLDVLVPMFEAETGYRVKVIAVGSGAALSMGQRGEADVLLVHAPAAELAFLEAGHGLDRTRVMYNDFVLVGPPEDPAGVEGLADVVTAFRRISVAGARFISRGDDSGTHLLERTLWEAAIDGVPVGASWYAETGQGMGATLTIAAETAGYALADRGTWLAAADHGRLPVLVQADERLSNVYHVIIVNAARHNHAVNEQGARAFRAFMVKPQTQDVISRFGAEEYGQPLFFPYAEHAE